MIQKNPIKDNRLVSSETFAVRFKQFLEWIPQNWWMSQPHYMEEYEYMMYVAKQLLNYQIQTATDEEEINYLKRLNLTEINYDKILIVDIFIVENIQFSNNKLR